MNAPESATGSDLEPLVRATGLLSPGDPVVVLYSGGRDSTCLLDCAVRIAGPGAASALHVNYGLRAEAHTDEAHCRDACAALGVALEVVHARPDEAVGNLQAWARRLRYASAAKCASQRGGDIAAGHTASDQVETILYRLASSPSRRALLGMRPREPVSDQGDASEGGSAPGAGPALVRPLLGFTRAQTTAHCEARGLRWREDASNASDHYARGRVRHGLVPALQAVHPAAAANVLTLAQVLADEAAVLDELVDTVLAGRDEIALETLRAQPPALRRLVVQRLADRAHGAPAAGVARRAEEVAALPRTGTASLDLPHVRATARRGIVSFAPTPPLAK